MSTDFHGLTQLQFNADRQTFIKSDDPGDNYIEIEYIPTSTSSWDSALFDIYFFENPYLSAENDVFEVDFYGVEERVGWIFPITILESNENDYQNFKNLNNYKFIAYKKLLEGSLRFLGDEPKENYNLRDFYNECSICILSKNVTSTVTNFNIDDYILSFYNFGYLSYDQNNGSKAAAIFDKSDFIVTMRSLDRKKITLKQSSFSVKNNDFIRALYHEHLLQSGNHVIRFIFLYQIIEDLMQVEFNSQFDNYLVDFQEKTIGKNDLKESLIKASSERTLVKYIFNRCTLFPEIKDAFKEECLVLFSNVNKTLKNPDSISDSIYDLRNLITHQFRDLRHYDNQLSRVIEVFERLITNTLLTYR